MEASSKASFKFIFIQHFVLIEQARTRDCIGKKGHFATPSLPVKEHPEILQAFAHEQGTVGLGTENKHTVKLPGIPNEQGGAGESHSPLWFWDIADLPISH